MDSLSPRQRQVFDAIKERKTPAEMAETLGMSRQHINNVTRRLHELGYITRAGALPRAATLTETYPWTVVAEPSPVQPVVLPRSARFRLDLPVGTQRGQVIEPIRQVLWPDPPRWSVQGVLLARADGRSAPVALPERRVVVVDDLETTSAWVWLVDRYVRWWHESDTDFQLGDDLGELLTPETLTAITLMIAAAIGVEAVLDITTEETE